jgi:hypothetical protein
MASNIAIERLSIRHPVSTLGIWSAILATVFTILFIFLMLMFASEEWSDIETFARTFDSRVMVQLIPLILLTPTVVILMASIHSITPERKKVFSLVGVALSSVYAAIICTNYYLQLFVVRLNLLDVDLEGLDLLVMANPRSVFVALETIGYAFLNLAMLIVSLVFTGGKLESWIRRMFILSGSLGIFAAIVAPFDQPAIFYTAFGLSLLAFPIATILVSLYFKKLNSGITSYS